MFKNVASQKLSVYVFDSTTNLPKTGDAANLTAYRSLDDGAVTVLGDTSATEQDATNAKGFYIFDLTQGETNGDKIMFSCKSATANMVCLAMPAVIYTVPPLFTTQVIDATGRVNAFMVGLLTTALTEGAGGRVKAAFTTLFDIAAPVLTAASVNQTGDNFARLGAPVGASISADIAAAKAQLVTINADTDDIQTRLPAALVGGRMDSSVGALAAAVITAASIAADAITAAKLAADVATEIQSGLSTSAALAAAQAAIDLIKAVTDQFVFTIANQVNSNIKGISDDSGAADRLEALMDGIVVAQINDVGATTTTFIADGFTEATNDHYKGRLITFISGALSGQQTNITAYTGATQTFTVTALTEAPANNDFFVIH